MTRTTSSPPVESLTAALLTPPGSGAIAAIGIHGDGVRRLLEHFFLPRMAGGWTRLAPGRVLLGDWRRSDGSSEELVAVSLPDASWEIQCHGGIAAAETVLSDLRSHHVRIISWQEWLALTTPDEFQSEALRELARASTPRTAAILLDQYRGALRRGVIGIRQQLETRGPCERAELLRDVDVLLDRWWIGSHLTTPWKVALVGAPNVGKSSLLNRILGYSRAIVFDQPGTTRDIVSAGTALDGWPVTLSDTAGIRATGDALEQAGVSLTRREAQQADLLVYLADGYRADGNPGLDSMDVHACFAQNDLASSPSIRVLSKWDLRGPCETVPGGWLAVSALTGEGVDELLQAIQRQLAPQTPEPGDPVPYCPRHQRHLARCRDALAANDRARAQRELDLLLGLFPAASEHPT